MVRPRGGVIGTARAPDVGCEGWGLEAIDREASMRIFLPWSLPVPADAVMVPGAALDVIEMAEVNDTVRAVFRHPCACSRFTPSGRRETRPQITGPARLPGQVPKMVLSGNPPRSTRFPDVADAALVDWFHDTPAIKDMSSPVGSAAWRFRFASFAARREGISTDFGSASLGFDRDNAMVPTVGVRVQRTLTDQPWLPTELIPRSTRAPRMPICWCKIIWSSRRTRDCREPSGCRAWPMASDCRLAPRAGKGRLTAARRHGNRIAHGYCSFPPDAP